MYSQCNISSVSSVSVGNKFKKKKKEKRKKEYMKLFVHFVPPKKDNRDYGTAVRLWLNRRIVYTDLGVLNLTTTVFDVLRIYRPILPILRLYFQIFQKSLSDSPILPILRFYLKTLKMILP